MNLNFFANKFFLPVLLSILCSTPIFATTIDDSAAPVSIQDKCVITIDQDSINYSVEFGKNYTKISKSITQDGNNELDDFSILPEKVALKVAKELGSGIEMGNWKTLSGKDFLNWWKNLESNQHLKSLKLKDVSETNCEDLVTVEQNGVIYSIDKKNKVAEVKGIKLLLNSPSDDSPSLTLKMPMSSKSEENDEEWKSVSGEDLMEWWKSNNDFNDKSGIIRIANSVTFDNVSYPVESIANSCFEGCNDLEYVIIPDSVKKISTKAFADCLFLKSVIFEGTSSLETIESSAFENSGIEFISLPKSLLLIDKLAFSNCKNLRILNIESPSLSVSVHAFNNCKNLSDMSIPCNFPKEKFNCSCLQLKNSDKNKFDVIERSYSKFGLMIEKKVGNGNVTINHLFSNWTKIDNEPKKMRKCKICNFVDLAFDNSFKGVVEI